MLRCVVAVACADNVIKHEELLFLRALVSHFKRHMTVTAQQVAQLKEDLKTHQSIDALLPHVTEKGDREQLILFAGLLAQSDGEVHPAEEELLKKIQAWCAPAGGDEPGPDPGAPGIHPPSIPAHAPVVPATPKMDINAFMNEVRDVVRQEVYQQALKTSGVSHGTGTVAVVDAFAEKSSMLPHNDSYDVVAEGPKLGKTMQDSLVPDERLLGKAHFHWIYTFKSILIGGGLIALSHPVGAAITTYSAVAIEYLTSGRASWLGDSNIQTFGNFLANPLVARVPEFGLFALGVLYILGRVLVQLTTEIVVTDSRLIVKQGVFSVRTFKADLSTLGQVDVNQSLLGNILGYGSIHIYTRNWGGQGSQVEAEGIYLPPVADPHAFSTLVDRARRMWRTRSV